MASLWNGAVLFQVVAVMVGFYTIDTCSQTVCLKIKYDDNNKSNGKDEECRLDNAVINISQLQPLSNCANRTELVDIVDRISDCQDCKKDGPRANHTTLLMNSSDCSLLPDPSTLLKSIDILLGIKMSVGCLTVILRDQDNSNKYYFIQNFDILHVSASTTTYSTVSDVSTYITTTQPNTTTTTVSSATTTHSTVSDASTYITSTQPNTTTTVSSATTTHSTVSDVSTYITSTQPNTTTMTVSSATTPSNATGKCWCACRSRNLTLEEKVENIKRELTLNKTTLSSSQRKLTSVSDWRPSSVTAGILAVLVIQCVVALVVLPDLLGLFCHIARACAKRPN